MKKFLLALMVGAGIFASCTKENTTTTKSQVRHIEYAMGGQSMYRTKAVNSTGVLDAINATLPESLDIYLTSQSTGKMFQGVTGEGIVLPSDEYKVVGSYNGVPASSEVSSTKTSYLASNPAIDINESLTVTDDVTSYTLTGTYKSFALVVDADEVERATATTTKGEEEITFLSSGDSRVIFGQGNFSNYLKIVVYPKDTERYKATTFTLATTKTSGTNLVEYGKFYVLHPTANGEQPKVVGLDLPTFIEGTL